MQRLFIADQLLKAGKIYSLAKFLGIRKFNPYHVPAGRPDGEQFTTADEANGTGNPFLDVLLSGLNTASNLPAGTQVAGPEMLEEEAEELLPKVEEAGVKAKEFIESLVGDSASAAQEDTAAVQSSRIQVPRPDDPNVANTVESTITGEATTGNAIIGGGGKELVVTPKIQDQISVRGWSEEAISETVNEPFTIRPSMNQLTGNDATAYYNKDGSYVSIDNVTHQIVQISKRGVADWIPDKNIVNPYRP